MTGDDEGFSPPNPTDYRFRESERHIYTEKKIGDEWIALWTLDDIPPGATVSHVTTIPYRRDRIVLPFKDGLHSTHLYLTIWWE